MSLIFDQGILYGGRYGRGLVRSIDTGKTWEILYGDTLTYAIASFATIGSTLYAGSNVYGVVRSTDQGVTWTKDDEGLGDPYVPSLTVYHDVVYAATGSGFFKAQYINSLKTASTLSGVNPLLRIFPNPATSFIQLEYQVNRQEFVSISIFDALGRTVVRSTDASYRETGQYVTTINTQNFSPGVYTARLTIAGEEQLMPFVKK
jgi:hypothetical protein